MAANMETASPEHSEQTKLIKIEKVIIECQPYSEFKSKYNLQLTQYYESQVSQLKKPWNTKRVSEVIQQIKIGKEAMNSGNRRTSMQYYWNSKYEVVISEETQREYLVIKKKKPEDPYIRIIPTEKYFDLLYQIHNELDHGGRDKITSAIKNKYYVQKKAIELFVALCPTCNHKRSIQRKKAATKHASENFYSHGLLDIVDFQAKPDGDYKWILKYQDRATKFIHIRPLKTDEAPEIALELLKIFLTFGAPTVLFSDNVKILNEIMKLWPQCNIFHGSCRPMSENNSELSKKDLEIILQTWMKDNSSSNWSLGCFFVQYQINTTTKLNDDKSSYRQLFGMDPKSMEQSKNDSVNYDEVKILTQNQANSLVGIKTENEDDEVEKEPVDETVSKCFTPVFIHHEVNIKTEIEEDIYEKDQQSNIPHVFDHHEIDIKTENEEVEQSGSSKNIHQDYKGVKRPASETIVMKKQKTCASDLEIGDTVKISVPAGDRGPSDTQFITGKITAFHNGLYQIATKTGILKDWFPRHELLKSNMDSEGDLPVFQLLTFKQAVTEQSLLKSEK